DPLARALAQKAEAGTAGTTRAVEIAVGEGFSVADIVCTSGPADRPFEERPEIASISLVLAGTFGFRSARGASLLSPGTFLLSNADEPFECSHTHGEGD